MEFKDYNKEARADMLDDIRANYYGAKSIGEFVAWVVFFGVVVFFSAVFVGIIYF